MSINRLELIAGKNSLPTSVAADKRYKQFGPRSGPTKCRSWSGFKPFETLMVFLKQYFKKDDFE